MRIGKLSLPLRECGLKCMALLSRLKASRVTPLAGVWIEIADTSYPIPIPLSVTPLAGVWIEIALLAK